MSDAERLLMSVKGFAANGLADQEGGVCVQGARIDTTDIVGSKNGWIEVLPIQQLSFPEGVLMAAERIKAALSAAFFNGRIIRVWVCLIKQKGFHLICYSGVLR